MNEYLDNRQASKYPDIEAAFESIVGFSFPEKPEDLPNAIILPNKAVGDLLESILALELDDPHLGKGGQRERSQFVGFLDSKGKLENSPVIVGSSKSTWDAYHEFMRWFRPLCGKEIKPLTYWHIHTVESGARLSTSDAAQRIGEDKKAIIYLLGAPQGIVAVFQSKKAIPDRIPMSMYYKQLKIFDELKWIYDSDLDEPDISALAKYFENSGYALYAWKKRNREDAVRDGVERGEFMEGIPLTRIGDPLWLRRARIVFDDED